MSKKIGNGKVRELYDVGDCLILVTTNRVSAFDCVLDETIPFKGAVLNKLSAFWFNLTKDICPNHMISIDDDMPPEIMTHERSGCCMLVKKQYIRYWLASSGWNKDPPAPHLPHDVICKTGEKYLQAYRRLTGKF